MAMREVIQSQGQIYMLGEEGGWGSFNGASRVVAHYPFQEDASTTLLLFLSYQTLVIPRWVFLQLVFSP